MAQKVTLRNLCDAHLKDNQEVDGETWEVLVRPAGSKLWPREVELCAEHASTLEAVAAFVAEFGRTSETLRKPASRVQAVPSGSRSEEVSSNGAKPYQCPDCGRAFDTPQGRGAHRHQVHGYSRSSDSAAAS